MPVLISHSAIMVCDDDTIFSLTVTEDVRDKDDILSEASAGSLHDCSHNYGQ